MGIRSRAIGLLDWARHRSRVARAPIYHAHAVNRIRRKQRAKVAFLPIHAASWKHDNILNAMLDDGRFDPVVVICPDVTRGPIHQARELARCRSLFESRPGLMVYNQTDSSSYVDVAGTVQPDIVFFQNPWGLTLPQYDIHTLFHIPGCYFPYTWGVEHVLDWLVNKRFHHLLWRFYVPSIGHLRLAQQRALRRGKNVVVTGYPGIDDLWPMADHLGSPPSGGRKRLVWAPHHTIPGEGASLDWSTFLRFSDVMLELAAQHEPELEVVFKPHPLLRPKLEQSGFWGPTRTKLYWNRWNDRNDAVEESGYSSLFASAHAIVHDCGSFLAEWLATGRPGMYLLRDDNSRSRLNAMGRELLDGYYLGSTEEDVFRFVTRVVLGGQDQMASTRESTARSLLQPVGNIPAATAIVNNLTDSMFR